MSRLRKSGRDEGETSRLALLARGEKTETQKATWKGSFVSSSEYSKGRS